MNRLSFAALALLACSTDTFVSPDSGTDGASDASTGDGGCPAVAPCGSGQTCANFDDSSFGTFFNASKPGGSAEFSSDKWVTCPLSLLAKIDQVTATATPVGAIATLLVTGQVSTQKAHLEADVFLPTNVPGAASYLALNANGDANGTVSLAVTATGTWLLWVQASTDAKPIAPRVGAWNHITLDVTFSSSGGTGHATLTFTDHNGQQVTEEIANSTMPGSINTITGIVAGIGIEPTSVSTGPVSAYYDDVVFGLTQ